EDLGRSPAAPLHPLSVCAAIQPRLEAGGILVSDGGEFGQWCQAALEARHRLINGPAGSIGSAVPMALGAKLARPELPVIATLGDGTFGFHALEFDTAVRHGIPIVAVVGNDARWNAEHQLQVQHYGAARAVGCALLPTRYDRVVMALGAKLARPELPVIATLGDGTFGFHALEFDTAVRHGIPIVAVVGNDARWNAEHQLQVQHYGAARAVGCALLPTRYDRVVEALGGHGERVERADELTPALERATRSGRPACGAAV